MLYARCSEAQMEAVATEILGLTNHIPQVYSPDFGLFSTIKASDGSGKYLLDIDELPGPDQIH